MPPEPPFGGSLVALGLVGGVQAPFTITIPSFPFNCFLSLAVFISGQLQDKVFRAAAMIAALFIHLGILYCSSQPNHEFFCYSLDSIRVITFWILPVISTFFFQLHQTVYSGFLGEWLATLQFPQGKEASGPRFGGAVCCLGPGGSKTTQLNLLFQPPWWP